MIYGLENKMWQFAKDGNKTEFGKLVSADAPENADLAGMFHVTSTWENRGGEWILVFNMDSRIMR